MYVKHSNWKTVKQIGARSNRLHLDSLMALIGSDSSNGKELNELWHKRIGHLHHGALKMLKETTTGFPVYLKTFSEEITLED